MAAGQTRIKCGVKKIFLEDVLCKKKELCHDQNFRLVNLDHYLVGGLEHGFYFSIYWE